MLDIRKYFGELPILKNIRETEKYIYLYHGTKTDFNKIKKDGLTIKDNGSIEARIKTPKIWFTPSKRYASIYGHPLLVKLSIEHVHFIERLPFQTTVNEYIYGSDIKPNKIIFPDQEEYIQIPKTHTYLS